MDLWVKAGEWRTWRFEDVVEYEESGGALLFSDSVGNATSIKMEAISAYTTSEPVAREWGWRTEEEQIAEKMAYGVAAPAPVGCAPDPLEDQAS